MEKHFEKDIIEEIAMAIDASERVYLHLHTGEFLTYPVADNSYEEVEFDYLKKEVYDVVDVEPNNYLRFDPLDSKTGYAVMEAFAQQLPESPKKELVVAALQGRKPFRIFRDTIENADMTEQWYDFKDAYLQMLVRDQIDQHFATQTEADNL